jgi:uncharacterized protein (TIGR00266 family)
MQYSINHGPSYPSLDFNLDEGEIVMAEPESMVAMSTSIEISSGLGAQTTSRFWGGMRSVAAGESMFTAIFRAKRSESFLSLAPRLPGDILHLMADEGCQFNLTKGAYLASTEGVKIDFTYAGVRGWMAKKGLFLMRTTGAGNVFCSSFGCIVKRELSAGEKFVVDNRFVIAFSATMEYQLVKAAKGVVNSYFSGGGLVNRYIGPGVLYYQTRGATGTGALGRMMDWVT